MKIGKIASETLTILKMAYSENDMKKFNVFERYWQWEYMDARSWYQKHKNNMNLNVPWFKD